MGGERKNRYIIIILLTLAIFFFANFKKVLKNLGGFK
jgi:hypothetical protein